MIITTSRSLGANSVLLRQLAALFVDFICLILSGLLSALRMTMRRSTGSCADFNLPKNARGGETTYRLRTIHDTGTLASTYDPWTRHFAETSQPPLPATF